MEFSRRKFVKTAAISTLTGALFMPVQVFPENFGDTKPKKEILPAHETLGIGQGINPGRVVWVHAPSSVIWDRSGFWWEPRNFNFSQIQKMLVAGLLDLTSANTMQEAWHKLFEYRNIKNSHTGGYKAGQKIAVKINMNGAGEYDDDPSGRVASSYGNAVLLKALLVSLVKDAGVRSSDITVYDTCRIMPDYMRKLCTESELANIKFSFRDPSGEQVAEADTDAPIHWSGKVRGEQSFLPKCVTQASYLINLANLKGHSWGMTLTGKNHFGSFVNSDNWRTPQTAGVHENIIDGQMGDYSVLADLMANEHLGGKTILWMLDALITAPSETVRITPENSRWEMEPFNGFYAASLFLSQDPVALDSVGADFLVNEPVMLSYNRGLAHTPGMENYLHEAAQLDNPPSKTKYANGQGKNPGSLGVHEHWNNPVDKKYSRNLGKKEGIELIRKNIE